MVPYSFTPLPNLVIDTFLPKLKPTEMAVLLVVIRQTFGWSGRCKRSRKKRDWIAGSQLRLKTGYSRKSISSAIDALVKHKLLAVYDPYGKETLHASERKGKPRLYYAFQLPELPVDNETAYVNFTQRLRSMYA